MAIRAIPFFHVTNMYLLKLKHWQAFVLIFILPFILQYALSYVTSALNLANATILDTLAASLPAIAPIIWLYTVGLYFYRRLPDSIKVSAVYFQLGSLYFILYILLLTYTLGIVRDNILAGSLPIGMLALLIPIHLFATFCYLYIAYFVARCIVSVQLQRIVAKGEYILVAIQLIFLPIGIWFLQPRLRKSGNEYPIRKNV